jgi:hypothetical protein
MPKPALAVVHAQAAGSRLTIEVWDAAYGLGRTTSLSAALTSALRETSPPGEPTSA